MKMKILTLLCSVALFHISSGRDSTNLIIEKIQGMSSQLIQLEVDILEMQEQFNTEVRLAQQHLEGELKTTIIPPYIQNEVQASLTDILKSRTLEEMFRGNVIEELNAITGSFQQFKKRFEDISRRLGDTEIVQDKCMKTSDKGYQGVIDEIRKLKTKNMKLTADLDSLRRKVDSVEWNCTKQHENITTSVVLLQRDLNKINETVSRRENDERRVEEKLTYLTQKVTDLEKITSPKSEAKDVVTIGDWILVFRAQAGIGISVYDTWMNDAIYHDNPVFSWLVKPHCVSLNTSCKTCNIHFKSRIANLWEHGNVQEVKLLLLKDSQTKAEILFDGKGSTKTNWLSKSRVISSTWTDLKTAPSNYFSIEGDSRYNRRFFVNSVYEGCPGDIGWLLVNDGRATGCRWDDPARFPNFIYSTKSTRAKTGGGPQDVDYADVMAILVKIGA